jgi:tetratricopeptide (TPR) repeat protein
VFVSHAGRDLAWAEWVAWELTDAGYQVELGAWDWAAGENLFLRMSGALESADLVLALYSNAYFEPRRFTTEEWSSVLARRERLVPLRIEDVQPPAVLAAVVFKDLFGLTERQARETLLAVVAGATGPPSIESGFPDRSTASLPSRPRLPGSLPAPWNVPIRSVAFTGRDGLLVELRRRLAATGTVAVQAVHGLGGVGKTSIAVEYAYRFANGYELVWWTDAERPEMIGQRLAELAGAAGWTRAGVDVATAVLATRQKLAQMPGWLIIFDNAEDPAALYEWVPSGPGHVLITSRNPAWDDLATPLAIDVFTRGESISMLESLAPTVSRSEADELAQALGDLPLALAQAAGVLAETGMQVAEYRSELNRHAGQVMADGKPARYGRSLAAAVTIAKRQLAAADEAAVQMLQICSFLAPEPVPAEFFTSVPKEILPIPLARITRSNFATRRAMGHIGRFGLGRADTTGLTVHRLTQAILRDDLDERQRETIAARARAIVVAVQPDDPNDPTTWPHWTRWLPHLLILEPTASPDADLRQAGAQAAWYLIERAEFGAGADLARRLYESADRVLGPDHPESLRAAHALVRAHAALGEYEQAHNLCQDTVTRYRRILGDDHPDTLRAANVLAVTLLELGQAERALEVNLNVLASRRRVLGNDHHEVLWSANNLAMNLYALGRYQDARELSERTLIQQRQTFGVDHSSTLRAAHTHALILHALGQYDEARVLSQDVLARRRRLFGHDNYTTLTAAHTLARHLHALGQHDEARELSQDVLTRRRRILGSQHPDTLATARHLAANLRAAGRIDEANAIETVLPRQGDGH